MIRYTLLLALCMIALPVVTQAAVASRYPSQGGQPGREVRLPASPAEAIIYPAAAQLTVREKLRPAALENGRGMEIILPWNADMASLTVAVDKATIQTIRHGELPLANVPDAPDSERAMVARSLEDARSRLALIQAEVAADEARIAFWSKPRAERFSQAEEVLKLDEAMDRALRELHGRLPELRRRLALAQQETSALEARLQNLGREQTALRVASIVLDSPRDEDYLVTYTYRLNGCGWQGNYRFDARPSEGLVLFGQEALLWQNSGFDWKGTEIAVATMAPGNRLRPLPLPQWIARIRYPEARPAARAAAKGNAETPAADMVMMAQEVPPAPEAVQMGTFTQWNLGKKDLPSGENLRASLQERRWKTEFGLTIRPLADTAAYLTAKPTLEEAIDLPQGQAMFLVDGSLVRQENFRYSGQEPELFFGVDPMVITEVKRADRSGADKGIISKSRSETWRWDITVSNTRNRQVSVRVEDALPRSTDESISVSVLSTPKPLEEDGTLVWRANLAAGQKMTIRHEVKMTAPADAPVLWGR